MTERRVCERCGTVLKQYSGRPVCPSCLLRGGLPVEPERAPAEKALPPTASRSLPHSFGDYELLEVIARGGMGIVYRARQRSLNRIVAIKMLQGGAFAQPNFIERFRAEAEAVARLQHPNIVAIHEIGELDGQPFFSMDYVEGKSLAQVSAEFGARNAEFRRCAGWVKTMAEAVHYAHGRDIIHRDLKPSNVLIDAFDQPHIADFGLAKRLTGDSDLTLTGQVLGSPNYLPPEQAAGKPSGVGSDVYSLGAILYHLLTGRPPFEAGSLTSLLQQVVMAEPVLPRLLNPGIPRDLETICLKCLEKEIPRRYATALELAQDLGRFLDNRPVQARPVTTLSKGLKWCRRRPALAGMAGAVVLALVLGSAGVLREWRRATHNEQSARQSEYAADMHSAQLAIAGNNRAYAIALLDKYRPMSNSALRTPHSPLDLRGWEWRYLWQLCQGDESSTLHHYPGGITALAVSPDGKLLAVATANQVALWDLTTQQPLTVVSNGASAPLAFVSTNGLLAMGFPDAAGQPGIALWDVKAGKVVKRLAHKARVRSLDVSPDGTMLATFDNQGSVQVIDRVYERILTNFSVSQPRYIGATVVVFSPDGKRLAIGEDYGRIQLLDRETWTLLPITNQLGVAVTALAFSPDSSLLAAGYGYGRGTIRLWDPDTGALRAQLTNHTFDVTALAFTPDGTQLASASQDMTIRIWNVADQSQRLLLQSAREGLAALAMLSAGKRLVSGGTDGSVCFWDATSTRPTPGYTNLAVSWPIASFALLDASSFQTNALDPSVVRRFGLAFTPDSRRFITMDTNGSLVLGDARALRLVDSLPAFGSNHWGLALSPDGRWLATGDAEGRVTIWDWANQHPVTNFAVPFDYLGLLHFARSGHYLMAGIVRNDQTKCARLWRTGNWGEVPLTGAQFAGLWSVALSTDDRLLAGGYGDGTVKVFRFPSWQPEAHFAKQHDLAIEVQFSPDDRMLASASWDGTIRLWDLVARRELEPAMRGHTGGVWGAAFSPDGRRLATGGFTSRDAVKLWDLAAHRELLSLQGEGLDFSHLTFSPDGSTLAATSIGGIAHLWQAPSWEEIEAAEKGKEIP